MKSKNDSSSESRDSVAFGLSKNDDSMSEFDDRSRSRSRSRSPGPSLSSSKIKDHDALSIYIGNLDYSATEDDLKNAFICCGDILRVTIIKNMKTGHPKGAAFIEFMSREGVRSAMKMNGTQVNGRPLTITSKKPKPERRPSRDRRDFGMYERRSSRSMAAYYPYERSSNGHSSRAYYQIPPSYIESRRSGHLPHHTSFESHRMSRHHDPYRRTDMYEPYLMPRGSINSHLVSHPAYYHTQKYPYGHSTRNFQTPRYSSSFARR